jgi:O-antigen/teichoic acid export membrane protein
MNKLIGLLFSATSKDSLVLLSGTIISNLINFLIVFILARNLSPQELGLIFTGLVFIQLVTDLFEFGINSTILTRLPVAEKQNQQKIISSSFVMKLIIGVVVGFSVALLSETISNVIFNNPNIQSVIQISGLGILLLTLIFWSQSVFQAKRDFLSSMSVNTSINILRLLAIGGVAILGVLNLTDVYFSMQVILIISVLYIIFKLQNLLKFNQISWLETKQILKFGLPIGLAFAMAALYTKLDQILILRISGEEEAGVYGVAQRLSAFFVFTVAAFNSAIVPRIVAIESNAFGRYFKKVVIISIGLAFLTSIGGFIISMFIPVIFGVEYLNSVTPFLILAIGMSLFILSIPFSSLILYRYKRNYYSFIISGLSLLLVFGLLSILVPIYNSVGAALSMLIVYLVQLIINYSYYKYLEKSH